MNFYNIMQYSLFSAVAIVGMTVVYYLNRKKSGGLVVRLADFFARPQAAQSKVTILISGIGGIIAISLVTLLGDLTGNILLMAPFGATCVLLFSVPQSPLSQPANVVGGHLVSSLVGMLLHSVFPAEWWAIGLAVGLAIAAMAALRITHPPAGADPLVIFFSSPSWDYILFPVVTGSALLVLIAWLFHKLWTKETYPSGESHKSRN